MPDQEDSSSSSPLTLPVHCRTCGRPLTVEYEPGRPIAERRQWGCPYANCYAVAILPMDIPGQIVALWAGHGDRPTGAKPA